MADDKATPAKAADKGMVKARMNPRLGAAVDFVEVDDVKLSRDESKRVPAELIERKNPDGVAYLVAATSGKADE